MSGARHCVSPDATIWVESLEGCWIGAELGALRSESVRFTTLHSTDAASQVAEDHRIPIDDRANRTPMVRETLNTRHGTV